MLKGIIAHAKSHVHSRQLCHTSLHHGIHDAESKRKRQCDECDTGYTHHEQHNADETMVKQ